MSFGHCLKRFALTVSGGTFALYSLICRHAKVSLIPNQLPSDARISSFRLKVPSPELERSLKIKERLENSYALKKLLLMLVLLGTSMVIADGVVTPAMSGFKPFFYLHYSYEFWRTPCLCIAGPKPGQGGWCQDGQPAIQNFTICYHMDPSFGSTSLTPFVYQVEEEE